MKLLLAAPALVLMVFTAACPGADYPLQDTVNSGGTGTVAQSDHNAYSLPLGNLPIARRLDFSVGNSFFRNPWVIAPSSTDARDGLGPLFNTNSCQGCHIKDGRGHPPAPGETAVSLFLRLSVPAQPDTDPELLQRHGFVPAPVYGSQLQTAAIPGMQPEARLAIDWQLFRERLDDGSEVELRRPVYRIDEPSYGPLPADLLISPRVAPPMIGLGLLEAIPEKTLLAAEDPYDLDGDGISGRANLVWDRVGQRTALGRFGLKAAEVSVLQQSMAAFAGDMGLSSTLVPDTDCTKEQQCDQLPDGGTPEVSDKIAAFVNFYAMSLAVPARRQLDDPAVQQGAELFNEIGCAACHTPRHTTGSMADRPELGAQVIWPYTDLLLHDMGDGLADGRTEFLADGNEWRTPPLWGLGLAQQINPRAGFLHDGRARTLEEAILWHGGEAQPTIERYRGLPAALRKSLTAFLNSL